jgi:hypothetical protein
MTKMVDHLTSLGVPADAGTNGYALETTVIVYDLDGLLRVLDLEIDPLGRAAHFEALFGSIPVSDEPDFALLRRVAAHVIGNEPLSDEDRSAVDPLFPITVAVTIANGPITVDKVIDLSTNDGTERVVTYTDVTMVEGGAFVCYATPLTFTCDTLTRTGRPPAGMNDFTIAGRTGAAKATPPQPEAATQAGNGEKGECSSAGIAGRGGQPGNKGDEGTKGSPGLDGNDGLPSYEATIEIKNKLTVDRALKIFTQSGPGGKGGDGGQGGAGQQGGNGGDGVTCGCTGNGGGRGNDGGRGGKGGPAGHGGNGVDARGNIYVLVPTGADVSKVDGLPPVPAPPGGPGSPGPGGPGGKGGGGSSGGKNNSGAGVGGDATGGDPGDRGDHGKLTGKPAEIEVRPR